MRQLKFTAIIQREGNGYVSLCPELDIASQGDTREEARNNLTEAIEGFLDAASASEVRSRLDQERYVESIEVNVG
jgi:predicted RNase H-like HicB family nuclease